MSSSSAPNTPRGCGSTTRAKPLIDAWVKSGNDTEDRASLVLAAGRAYRCGWSSPRPSRAWTIRTKEKAPPVKASIALEWKPPQRRCRDDSGALPVAEPLPRNVVSRRRFRRTIAVSAGSAARRFPRRGTRRQPTPPWRRPAMWPLISASCPACAEDAADREAKAARLLPYASPSAPSAGR